MQAKDRAHRLGQQRHVMVFVLVCPGTVEEVILESSLHKRTLDAKVIQAGLFNEASTADDRLGALRRLLRASADVPAGAPSQYCACMLSRVLALCMCMVPHADGGARMQHTRMHGAARWHRHMHGGVHGVAARALVARPITHAQHECRRGRRCHRQRTQQPHREE
jgi:hypothetical protein